MASDVKALLAKVERDGDFRRLTFRAPEIARRAAPGQFVMVRASTGRDPLLRRPFGLHDRSGDEITLFFKVVGRGTALLAGLRPGDETDILGPLGNGFRPPAPASGALAFLVGGGRGVAPLFFLANDLHAAGTKVRVLYGGRSRSELAFRDRFDRQCWETLYATDDGSFGTAGLVSHLAAREIERSRPAVVYACGPDPMLRAVAGLCRERDVPAQLSLEALMGCGIGACWGCVCRIREGGREAWTKICEHGPVFDREDVAFPGGS